MENHLRTINFGARGQFHTIFSGFTVFGNTGHGPRLEIFFTMRLV